MKITFNNLDVEIINHMKEYIAERYKIEVTDEWDDYVTCKQLRQHCFVNHIDYSELKDTCNLQGTTIKRNYIKYRGFRGIKLVDNSPLEKEESN